VAGCVLTFIESFQLFSALEELELKRRNPASELPIKWNQGVVNQENPENQLVYRVYSTGTYALARKSLEL